MIVYKINEEVDIERLVTLFNEAGWNDKTIDLERLKIMVANSDQIVTAWDDSIMVGFARCTTDHVFNGQLNNVVVDAKYRKRGIGKNLVIKIIESNPKVTYILRPDPEYVHFYTEIGFRAPEYALIFERKE